MRMEFGLQTRQELRLRLSPQIIQSIEILQLPTLELNARITRELEENPALEAEAPPDEMASQPEPAEAHDAQTLERLDAIGDSWRDFRRSSGPQKGSEAGDKKLEALQNVAAPSISLQAFLLDELRLLSLEDRIRLIAEFLIGNLDPNGYLRYPLEDLFPGRFPAPVAPLSAEGAGPDAALSIEGAGPAVSPGAVPDAPLAESAPPAPDATPKTVSDAEAVADGPPIPRDVTREEIEAALQAIQRIGPPGVGARDLQECLLLQVPANAPGSESLRRLIVHHLHDLEHNRLPAIAKSLGTDVDGVKRLLARLRTLNPRPGSAFSSEQTRAVVPDIVLATREDGYDILIEDRYIPRLSLSDRYAKMLESPGLLPKEKDYIRRRLETARWLMEAIAQRRQTLWRITRSILDVQNEFLDQGVSHLKPLKMQEVADRVGIHVSNVSRAIADKYIETPRGILPLKFFFTGSTPSANGAITSRVAVKERIREMIGQEDKKRPLSDDDIGEILKKEGYLVARRTVTKYRKILKVPSSRQRRAY